MNLNDRRLAVATTLVFVSLGVLRAAPNPCANCLPAQYWHVPQVEDGTARDVPFPETPLLADRWDVGLAFSGGGTRSASSTLGQLRGMAHNGWLDHVRYISAVSGGAWAATVYTYSKRTDVDLLGTFTPSSTLTADGIKKTANGRLGQAISSSSLTAGSVREASGIALQGLAVKHPKDLIAQIAPLLSRLRREGTRDNKTYARLLGDVFIDDVLEQGQKLSGKWFTWDALSAAEIAHATGGQISDFVVPHTHRPFLITSATLVSARRDYAYPLLMPVEYTPLYVGVRGEFGAFGGSYIAPWAYDAVEVGTASDPSAETGTIEVRIDASRRLTLADMIASTGAAPELFMVLGGMFPESIRAKVQLATAYFPAFRHLSVGRRGQGALSAEMAHADGGAEDNLGLLPLLARQVHNVVVFVNTSTPYAEDNKDIQSLFGPVGPPDTSGDKRFNTVFDAAQYPAVLDRLTFQRDHGEPQVYCARDWSVHRNDHFNIRPYTGLNICFVYNAPAARWMSELKVEVRALLSKGGREVGRSDNFPWYATFNQNKLHLIQLTKAQVNLLADLNSWMMTDDETLRYVRQFLPVLPCPLGKACTPTAN